MVVGRWLMVVDGGRGVLSGDGFASRRRWCSITAAWERFGARGLRRRRATFDAQWFQGERSMPVRSAQGGAPPCTS